MYLRTVFYFIDNEHDDVRPGAAVNAARRFGSSHAALSNKCSCRSTGLTRPKALSLPNEAARQLEPDRLSGDHQASPARRRDTEANADQSLSASPCPMASTRLSRTILAKGKGTPRASPAVSASRRSLRPSRDLNPGLNSRSTMSWP